MRKKDIKRIKSWHIFILIVKTLYYMQRIPWQNMIKRRKLAWLFLSHTLHLGSARIAFFISWCCDLRTLQEIVAHTPLHTYSSIGAKIMTKIGSVTASASNVVAQTTSLVFSCYFHRTISSTSSKHPLVPLDRMYGLLQVLPRALEHAPSQWCRREPSAHLDSRCNPWCVRFFFW